MQLGRYEVLRKLGEGGMARVLLARSATGNQVVLKVPFTQSADFAERVRDEARVGLRVHHRSVVDTLDLFEHDGRPILVVEYVEGASLQQVRRHGGPMPAGLVARIGRQVADGLAFIHDATDENDKPLNILHRDVAPGNILVTADGNAKLIDLGIARGVETKAKKTQIGTVRGTMRYLAPELLAGEPHTPATDLWALGVVLFEAALGRRAAEGDEREVLATIVRGDIGKLRDGETLDPALRDGIFALLAPREARLQRAKAAMNVMMRIEESLSVDESWSQRVVSEVLARMHARWAEENPAADIAGAVTLVRTPSEGYGAPHAREHDEHEPATAATMPSMGPPSAPWPTAPVPGAASSSSSSPFGSAPSPSSSSSSSSPSSSGLAASPAASSSREAGEPRTSVTDPRPRVAPDQELGHADGVAPTVRMSAVDLESAMSGAAATEMMAAVDVSGAPGQADAATRLSSSPLAGRGLDQTQKFPKPGPASSPGKAADDGGSSSLAWRSVAAPTLLGLTASDVAPPRPATLNQQRSEPVIAAAPDEKTEAGADPPRPPGSQSGPSAPAPSMPPLKPSKEFSGPLPRMLRVADDPLANDTELAQPAVSLSSLPPTSPSDARALPEAHATPRTPVAAPPRTAEHAARAPSATASRDPAHRPPDPKALGIPTPLPSDQAAAATAAASDVIPGPEEATETAFPYGVPDSLTPSEPIVSSMRPRLVSDDDAPLPATIPPDTVTAPMAPQPSAAPTTPQPAPPAARGALARRAAAAAAMEGDSDRTMRVPPAPRAGFIGQAANEQDTTERVERWSQERASEAADGFDEALLSGELDWRPNRTKHIAIAAGVVVALVVAAGLLVVLDVL